MPNRQFTENRKLILHPHKLSWTGSNSWHWCPHRLDVLLEIWVLSTVGLWVGKELPDHHVFTFLVQEWDLSTPSTLHQLSFARLHDSLYSPHPSLWKCRRLWWGGQSLLCLPPTPCTRAGWRPLCEFLLPELPMSNPLQSPLCQPSWPVLFCTLAGQLQGPQCLYRGKHCSLFSGRLHPRNPNKSVAPVCALCVPPSQVWETGCLVN